MASEAVAGIGAAVFGRGAEGEDAARRAELLRELRKPLDGAARQAALAQLRELDGVQPAPPDGFRPSLAQAARRDEKAARRQRAEQLKRLATGKAYMHAKHMEQLKQTAQLEQHHKFRADVLEMYQREDADWGQVVGERGKSEAGPVERPAAEAAAAEVAAAEGQARDEDGDLLDDEGDAADEEFEHYRWGRLVTTPTDSIVLRHMFHRCAILTSVHGVRSKRSSMRFKLGLMFVVAIALVGAVAGLLIDFHMRVHQCSFAVGKGGAYSKTLRRNFTALNVKRVFVYKNTGHVKIGMDDRPDIRVEVTHHARTFEAMNQIETLMYQESGMISVLSSWKATLDRGFNCPQSDVLIWLPRSIAEGVLSQRLVWDPEALGPGRGAYREPTPVAVENRPDIEVVVNGTDESSWMTARRGDVRVELHRDVAVRNVSLRSNMGEITALNMSTDRVDLQAVGTNANLTGVRAGHVEVRCQASEFYPRVEDVWPWIILAMWPATLRSVGTAFMSGVTHCPTPCSIWEEQIAQQAQSAAPVVSGSKFGWLVNPSTFVANAYNNFAGHVASNALVNDASYWNGEPPALQSYRNRCHLTLFQCGRSLP